nr:E3 ubiquitin/ISG15 ligase TRIM25 [Solea senegalensis]
MGAALDVPAQCPLCNELTRDPVTLKCHHRFCSRCIGDLWSIAPNGPYHCPEFRCKTVYQTLPFDRSFVQLQSGSKPWPEPNSSSSAATSNNHARNKFDSALRRPSLTSRLLGKRKAGAPASEPPDTKRSTVSSPCEQSNSTETPTTSFSHKFARSSNVETSKEEVHPESSQSEHNNAPSSGKRSGSEAVPGSNMPQVISNQQSQCNSEVITVNETDSSDEVDICEAPLLATPRKKKQVTGLHASPRKPASPANSDCSPGVSHTDKGKSPDHPAKPPLLFTKHSTASGSSSHKDIFSMTENKNTSPVPCHYCPKMGYQSAVKTCLVCGASMCKEHLRPHLDSPVFQSHTLVPPVEDISPWRCQEHHEMNRIYCRQCEVCVCTVCTVIGSHRGHVCISIREAESELRGNLKEEIKQLQNAEQQVMSRVTELTEKKETSRVALSEAREGVQQQYGAIREVLEQEEQSALQCVMKEESRVVGGLEEKLGQLQSSLLSIQQGLHTLEGLADSKGDKRIQDQAFIMEYSKVAQLANDTAGCVEQFEVPEEVDRARLKCLQRWTEKRLDTLAITEPGKDRDLYRLLYGTIPILDSDTAHSKLQLSENNRRAIYTETQQLYTEHEARFSCFPQVLASCAMDSGRWYWEVNVSVDDGRWKVGVCEGQIERKGQKDSSRLGFNVYSWCIACDKKKVEAQHNKVSVPVAVDRLNRVGVFLDFEEGILSFFNVTPGGSLALMYSYKHSFSDPLYPAFSVSKTQLAVCDLFHT